MHMYDTFIQMLTLTFVLDPVATLNIFLIYRQTICDIDFKLSTDVHSLPNNVFLIFYLDLSIPGTFNLSHL